MQIELALMLSSLLGFGGSVMPATNVTSSPSSSPSSSQGILPPYSAIEGSLEFSNELIVRPKQSLTRAQRTQAIALLGREVLRYHAATDEFILSNSSFVEPLGSYENRRSQSLLASGLFQYSHPNWTVYPCLIPNDLLLADQWHHLMMKSLSAWDISSGSPSVIVAVTDTGIVTHEDLTHRVPGYNAVSQVAEADGGDVTDIHGHGTHVAGCAAATGDNEVGVAGTGWNLSVMPIRVSEATNGGASYESLLEGSRWAIEHGAKVTSASYSGIGYDAIETTGAYIHSLDGSLMWAAGNSGANHSSWDFENVLVIGASDPNDQRAWFSSYGLGVDLFSPGVGILSTTPEGSYQAWSGTSMATPVANGVLGVIRSVNPALSARHAEYILLHACQIWGGVSNSEEWGFGRINFHLAADQAIAAMSPQAPIARNDFKQSFVASTVDIDALMNDYDANMDALVIDWVASASSQGDVVTLLPANGTSLRDQVRVVGNVNAQPGNRTIPYRLREPISGARSDAVITVNLAPLHSGSNPVGELPGLACEYYALGALNALPDWSLLTPYMQEIVPQVNIASSGNNFANSGRADQVGAVYQGWLRVPTAGLWTLAITSDDGSRMYVGSELAINNDGLHGMQTVSAQLALGAGMYPIRLEFFENGGGAGFIVSWSAPGSSSQVIAPEFFFHGGGESRADLNHDGRIDAADLSMLLGMWGTANANADINLDGIVNAIDLSILLSGWGE